MPFGGFIYFNQIICHTRFRGAVSLLVRWFRERYVTVRRDYNINDLPVFSHCLGFIIVEINEDRVQKRSRNCKRVCWLRFFSRLHSVYTYICISIVYHLLTGTLACTIVGKTNKYLGTCCYTVSDNPSRKTPDRLI